MIKEFLIVSIVCLVIGAAINGANSLPPVAPMPTESAQPAQGEATSEATPAADSNATAIATAGDAGAATLASTKAGETTDASFDSDVLKSQVPVLVDFNAAWCAPCQTMLPIIDNLASDYNGKIKVFKMDTDRNPVVSGKFHVNSLPTFMMFRDGHPVSQYSGAMAKEMLAGVIDQGLGIQ